MYADDTCVNIASENLNELLTDLKNELENVSNWMRINKLSLNASKSEYMVIGHRRQLNKISNDFPDLVLNNEVIKRVDKTKYLGINIDESLNWKEQYKAIKNKLKGTRADFVLNESERLFTSGRLTNHTTQSNVT